MLKRGRLILQFVGNRIVLQRSSRKKISPSAFHLEIEKENELAKEIRMKKIKIRACTAKELPKLSPGEPA